MLWLPFGLEAYCCRVRHGTPMYSPGQGLLGDVTMQKVSHDTVETSQRGEGSPTVTGKADAQKHFWYVLTTAIVHESVLSGVILAVVTYSICPLFI